MGSEKHVDGNVFLTRKTTDQTATLSKLEKQVQLLESRVEEALSMEPLDRAVERPENVMIWGVPYSILTLADTLRHIERLIEIGEPGYFITGNLNYNMLTHRHPDLRRINDSAAFIVCDGMPMVIWSKMFMNRLPERVAGSELIYALSKWASIKGHRVFFLGGAPGVANTAAKILTQRYSGLQVAGVESPPFRSLTERENQDLINQIRDAKPAIVYVAFGQPKGERWIAEHVHEIGAPICVQIGASFDFVAGGVARAPLWLQKMGMEWSYRLAQEPGRLAGRYWQNGLFLLSAMARDLFPRSRHNRMAP